MHKVKPRTPQAVGSEVRRGIVEKGKSHTYVKNPTKTGAFDDTSVVKGLYEECKGKTTPCTDTVSSRFPKKDSDGTTCNTCYCCRKHEHSTESLIWWINGRENAEFEDENRAYEG